MYNHYKRIFNNVTGPQRKNGEEQQPAQEQQAPSSSLLHQSPGGRGKVTPQAWAGISYKKSNVFVIVNT